MKLHPVLWAVVVLVGCSSGTTAEPHTPAGDSPDAEQGATDESAPSDETPEERTIRLAKEKRAQCQSIGDTIQAEPEIDIIANINDAPTLKRLAGELDASAKKLEGLEVTNPQLTKQREQYLRLLHGRAQALRDAAATTADDGKDRALKSYQENADGVGDVLAQINQFCNSEALE